MFGTAAAVCFSAVKPIADRAFGPEETEQEPITIAKDEPEAQQPVQTECAPVPEETEPVGGYGAVRDGEVSVFYG